MKYSKHISLYILCLLLCLSNSTSAQSTLWEAPIGSGNTLGNAWKGDRLHYKNEEGSIVLNAPPKTNRSCITTQINLAQSVSWQGFIRMKALPTSYNHSYILLAQIAELGDECKFLALAFGGQNKRISLCETSFICSGNSYIHQAKKDIELIHNSHLPKQLLTGISYQVTLDEGKNLYLYLSNDTPTKLELIEQVELNPVVQLPQQSIFGIYNAYTESKRQGVYFSQLRILQGHSGLTSDNNNLGQDETNKQGTTEDGEAESSPSLLLSEIMANPRTGSAEYIELYNNSNTETSLTQYSLALGSDKSSLRIYPMSRLKQSLAPHAYYILTNKPQAIKASYPDVQDEHIIEAKLPQLRNAGFVIQLHHRGKLIDDVLYSPESFPKGLRSKRGIALERSLLTAGQVPWLPARKEAGYATPTNINSQNGRSYISSTEDSNEEHGELITRLIQILESDNKSRASIFVYDYLGNTLSITPQSQSLSKLKEIESHPYQGLQSLSAGAKSAILIIYLTDGDGHKQSYDLKYQLR